jgi:hypothetical protein
VTWPSLALHVSDGNGGVVSRLRARSVQRVTVHSDVHGAGVALEASLGGSGLMMSTDTKDGNDDAVHDV